MGRDAEIIPFPSRQAGDQTPDGDQPGGELATRSGNEVEDVGSVLDAEIVDEVVGPVRRATRPAVRRVKVVSRRVSQHQPTVRTSKWVARNLTYVFAGVGVLANRWWLAKTNSSYEQAMRALRAAGDWDRLADWEQRGELARERRHKRRMDMIAVPFKVAKALATAIPSGALFLLVIGLLYAAYKGDFSVTLDPLFGVAAAIGWVAAVVGVLWSIGIILVPMLLVGGLWHVGRQAQFLPQSLRPPTMPGDMMPSELTEDTITAALAATVPDFDRAIKAGWKVRYRIPPRADEGGTHFQLDLPPKAPVEVFVKRKRDLAHNLRRFPIEVWPTEPIAGVLDGWIADPGVLTKPVGPWPVLEDLDNARCDYFKGIPVAMTLRGKVVASPLGQKNYFLAGIMGSGKSSMAITLVLGAILDPLVDVDVVVMAENADYEPMRPALRSLHTGAEPDTVEAAIQLLRDRFRSLGELGELLREQMDITAAQGREPDKFICREYAEREPRLRPRVMVIDECQNLFMSEHGKDAEVIVKQLVTTARKYATTLIFVTPDPTGDAIPSGVVRIMSNRACFPIGDQIGNDAAIGTGSHKIGLTAANLVPAIDDQLNDAGTCAARGFTNPPGMLRCFYVPQSDAHRVTKRALQLRGRRQITAGPQPAKEVRDLLDDVAAVLKDKDNPVPAADIPALLADRFPDHVLYRQLNGKQLRGLLWREYKVKVPSTDNRWWVSPKLIAEGLERRRNDAEQDMENGP